MHKRDREYVHKSGGMTSQHISTEMGSQRTVSITQGDSEEKKEKKRGR